jgi:hypothetical protein
LAEALEMDPPVMPDDGPTRVTTVVEGSSHGQGKEVPAMEPVWDDEDTRSFYESLPDLRLAYSYIPSRRNIEFGDLPLIIYFVFHT